MNYVFDLILLGVFVLFTAVGVRRGLIRSAVHFLGSILAAFLASALGGVLARWVFDAMFRDALVEKIDASIASAGLQNTSLAVGNLFASLPDFLVRALNAAGVTVASLEGILATKTGQTAELITDSLTPVFVSFLKVLAVIVLFLLFMILVKLLAEFMNTLFRLPILRQLNGALGGLFGFLVALITVWVLLAAVHVFVPMLSPERQVSLQGAIDKSILAGVLIRSNPLGFLY